MMRVEHGSVWHFGTTVLSRRMICIDSGLHLIQALSGKVMRTPVVWLNQGVDIGLKDASNAQKEQPGSNNKS